MSFLRRYLVLLLVGLGLAFRLLFVGHDLRDLVTRGPIYDDSFYSFTIARNIAAGFGSTFDRVEATNGYQPLYVLLLVPIYWVTGNHPNTPIYVALVASAILNVLTGWILYRLVRRYASQAAALFGLVLWSFGAAIVRQAVNGLETALAMFLLAATLEYYLVVYRARPTPGRREVGTLGLLLGLAIFARIDAGLFAVALAADVAWRDRRRAAWVRFAAVLAIAAAVIAPWCIASRVTVGAFLPESGSATRFLSTAYAPHDYPSLQRADFADGPPGSFLLSNLGRSFLQLGTSPVMQMFTRASERILNSSRLDPDAALTGVGGMLLLGLAALLYAAHRQRLTSGRERSGLGFLYLYAILLLAAYSFVVFGQIFYSRYYYPLFFLSIIVGAFAYDLLIGLVSSPRARNALAATIAIVYAIGLPYMAWHRLQNGNYRFLHVVDWIAAHTPSDATIGVFNSGAIGYFSDRRVVNLDGKVNPAAFAALRSGTLRDYVAARGIDYVIDHEWIVQHFLLDDVAEGSTRFERIAADRTLGVRDWVAYRVVRNANATTPGHPIVSRLRP